ncbi:MAG: hypothetical protein A2751_02865 [Candidatus Doudnabacteria bacterium RIFCSPHIGHO2_01_FULL_46_14]|uniref:PEP-utilising enzyme mobile domain-containing protein n=1 Tax=Candidatus Doudnabacteria bacterium RIFCSPHIGHO2_01_FULL_46_14 TaxID=1817824 RepID=A0A1F5NK11_9BACT|nr:MAG: hypothetical protein A2751_02865 [Candidatus Doudnabacteria bacterium RIFCSPHIGHO2_01_FULL_46_14]
MKKLTKIFSREYSVQYTEIAIRSLNTEAKKYLPALVYSQTYLPENGNEACYVYAPEWQAFLDKLAKKYKNKENLKQFFKKFHAYGKAYVATAKRAAKGSLNSKNDGELLVHYQHYQKALLKYSTHLWIGFFLAQGDYLERAKKILARKGIVNTEITSALFLPNKLSSILALQDKLGSIKKRAGHLNKKQVQTLLKHYAWMPCLDIHNNPWSADDLNKFFAHLKPSGKQISFTKAVKLARLARKEIEIFKLLRELVYIKDMRDEYRRRGIYNVLPLFETIAGRLGPARKHLAYFTSDEIISALNKSIKLSKAAAQSRQKGFLIYRDKTKTVVSHDQSTINNFIKGHVENKTAQTSIQGTVAMLGTATGHVKIVRGIKDLAKVKPGDIMIAITTHPDFITAMHRAAAIVTDEGGLTSHAAIVSRELGIPCVVGTKNATRILNDGDLVNVDANKGIVRRD